ncbi:MAG: DUF6122 family protein [Arenicellales bacterium WSBS_2016_MAG_OTU3]
MIHIALHFLVPFALARLFYRKTWLLSFGLMMASMLIDIDHLLATPVYDPARCGVGFHPLHSAIPILIYLAILFYPKTRVVGLGLCVHIVLDSIDCQITNGVWFVS